MTNEEARTVVNQYGDNCISIGNAGNLTFDFCSIEETKEQNSENLMKSKTWMFHLAQVFYDKNAQDYITTEDAVKNITEAVNKQIAKTPGRALLLDGTHRYCPTCGQYFGKQHPHCYNCGQKLDWGDNKVDNPKSNLDKDGDNNAKIN